MILTEKKKQTNKHFLSVAYLGGKSLLMLAITLWSCYPLLRRRKINVLTERIKTPAQEDMGGAAKINAAAKDVTILNNSFKTIRIKTKSCDQKKKKKYWDLVQLHVILIKAFFRPYIAQWSFFFFLK